MNERKKLFVLTIHMQCSACVTEFQDVKNLRREKLLLMILLFNAHLDLEMVHVFKAVLSQPIVGDFGLELCYPGFGPLPPEDDVYVWVWYHWDTEHLDVWRVDAIRGGYGNRDREEILRDGTSWC